MVSSTENECIVQGALRLIQSSQFNTLAVALVQEEPGDRPYCWPCVTFPTPPRVILRVSLFLVVHALWSSELGVWSDSSCSSCFAKDSESALCFLSGYLSLRVVNNHECSLSGYINSWPLKNDHILILSFFIGRETSYEEKISRSTVCPDVRFLQETVNAWFFPSIY